MARFTPAQALETVLRYPVVPVFYHPDAAHAERMLLACYRAGLRVFEFTNRGENALDVFVALAKFVQAHCPDMLLGRV